MVTSSTRSGRGGLLHHTSRTSLWKKRGLCCKKEADLVRLGKNRTKRIYHDRTEPLQVASFPGRPHSDVAPVGTCAIGSATAISKRSCLNEGCRWTIQRSIAGFST